MNDLNCCIIFKKNKIKFSDRGKKRKIKRVCG